LALTGISLVTLGAGVMPFGITYIYYLILRFLGRLRCVVSFNRAHKSTKAEPADNNLSLGVFIINFLARS